MANLDAAKMKIEIQWPAWWVAWQELVDQMPPWWGICLISPRRIVCRWRIVGHSKWREGTIILSMIANREGGEGNSYE